MTNLKTYKDGSRLILVVENCTGELAAKVNAFVLDLLGTNEPQPIPEVVPIKETVEEIPEVRAEQEITKENGNMFNAPAPEEAARNLPVEGVSGTLGGAIDTGDTRTVVRVCAGTANLNESMRYTVVKICKAYLLKDCLRRDPETATTHKFTEFCEIYQPLIVKSVKDILRQAGYEKLSTFIAGSSEEMHKDAYARIIDDLIGRMSKD